MRRTSVVTDAARGRSLGRALAPVRALPFARALALCITPPLLVPGALAIGEGTAHAAHRPGPASHPGAREGRAGGVVVLVDAPTPERLDPEFVAGLLLDLDGRHREALDAYEKAVRMRRCGPRCRLHRRLSAELLEGADEAARAPDDASANVALAIGLHNKVLSLRLDTGRLPDGPVRRALAHYEIALALATPAVRNDILLGAAALDGELGDVDRAAERFEGVDAAAIESPTGFGNLAYYLTTVGRNDDAYAALERALTLEGGGGAYREWAVTSDDFHRIRHHARFKEIVDLH